MQELCALLCSVPISMHPLHGCCSTLVHSASKSTSYCAAVVVDAVVRSSTSPWLVIYCTPNYGAKMFSTIIQYRCRDGVRSAKLTGFLHNEALAGDHTCKGAVAHPTSGCILHVFLLF